MSYKKYDAELVNDYFLRTQQAVYDYDNAATEVRRAIQSFVECDENTGQTMDAAKELVGAGEVGLLDEIQEIQNEIIDSQTRIKNSFEKNVDPASNARIDTEILEQIEGDFKHFHKSFDEIGIQVEDIAAILKSKYGEYADFTTPNFESGRQAMENLCGGYSDSKGFLFDCMNKMEEFDTVETAALREKELDKRMELLNHKIRHADSVFSSFTPYDVDIKKESIRGVLLKTQQTSKRADLKNVESTPKSDLYNALPAHIRNHISKEEIRETEDGFFISTVSIEELFIRAGADKDYPFEEGDNPTRLSDFDDWYVAGVKKEGDRISYTLIKVREPGDSQSAQGTAVPFMSVRINEINEAIRIIEDGNRLTSAQKEALLNSLSIWKKDVQDKTLTEYFADSRSQGSYLIASHMINKMKGEMIAVNNHYEYHIKNDISNIDSYSSVKLTVLKNKGVFDTDRMCIIINDKSHLSQEEFNALLIIATSSEDIYTYAAENQFHADNYGKSYSLFGLFFEEHLKVSDAGVGESKHGASYEDMFRGAESKYYSAQKEIHGDDEKRYSR